MSLPPPSQLGLPAYFDSWRPHQPSTVEQILAAPERFIGVNAPTGFGKSAVGEVIAQFTGGRSCYLVMTKPLADQITDPVRGIPYRYDVRGKANYDCKLLHDHGVFGLMGRCDKAEALCDGCQYKDAGCHYFDKIRAAAQRLHPVTNYDFWLSINEYREGGIGNFDLLICDEAHDIYKKLSSFMRIDLRSELVESGLHKPPPREQSISKWRDWATQHYSEVFYRLDAMQAAVKAGSMRPGRELHELKRLLSDLEHMLAMGDDWVEDRTGERGVIGFEPIDVAPYAHKLFRSVPKVLLMSAMLRPKHFTDLGIALDQYRLIEAPSSFEVVRRPVIHIRTVQQSNKMTEAAKRTAVQRLDQLISARLDRNGIVHPYSYERAQYIGLHSTYSGYMLLHDSKGVARAVEEFKRRKDTPPAILDSPSVMTGYNFPDDEARWQCIYKLPFPYGGSPVVKARQQRDPDSGKFTCAVDFIQACGRIVRGIKDWGETFCIDNAFADWFWFECVRKGWAPGWFIPAVRLNQTLAPPIKF